MRSLTLILFACCIAATVLAQQRKRYDGHQLLQIHPRGQDQVDFVYGNQDDNEMDFWYEGRERVDILVPPHKVVEFKNQLTSRNIFYNVENADIQKDIDVEFERLSKKWADSNLALDYNDFNTYEAIMLELDELVTRCPAGYTCATFNAGNSYAGRAIRGLSITRGSGRRAIWLDATTHAREWLSTATHLKIVQQFVDNPNDPQVSNLLATYDLYFVPVCNPDGYVHTQTERLWRKNRSPNAGSACIGTDLNRNYNQMWGNAGASTSPCSDTYRGSSAGSEPETRAIQGQLSSLGSRLLLSIHFHTYGNLWLHPWGSVNPDQTCNYAADEDDLLRVSNAAANAIQQTYNTRWERGNSCKTIYPASGITMDYSKGVAGVKYTFTPELRGNNFIIDKSQIQPSFVEVWNGFLAAIRAIEQSP